MEDEVKRAADIFWNASRIPDDVWGAWLMRESARLMREHLKHVNDQISVDGSPPAAPDPPAAPRWGDED